MALGYSDPLRRAGRGRRAAGRRRIDLRGLRRRRRRAAGLEQEPPAESHPASSSRRRAGTGSSRTRSTTSCARSGRSGRNDAARPRSCAGRSPTRELMPIYWRNVRALPAVARIEQGARGGQRRAERVGAARAGGPGRPRPALRALVGAAGAPELARHRPTTCPASCGDGRLRDRYAPRSGAGLRRYGLRHEHRHLVGPAVATRSSPPHARPGSYYLDLGRLGLRRARDRLQRRGPEPRTALRSTRLRRSRRVVAFVREFVKTTRMPMMLESVPLGNSVSRTIDDRPYHWRDSWVEWLIGTDAFSGLRNAARRRRRSGSSSAWARATGRRAHATRHRTA